MSEGIFDPTVTMESLQKVVKDSHPNITSVIEKVVDPPMPTNPMPTNPMPTSSSTSLVVCEPTLLDTILGYLKDHPWIVALLIIVIGCGIIYNQKTKERELDKND